MTRADALHWLREFTELDNVPATALVAAARRNLTGTPWGAAERLRFEEAVDTLRAAGDLPHLGEYRPISIDAGGAR